MNVDLLRFPVTYYFYDDSERTSLPARAPALLSLAKEGLGAEEPATRLRAAMLRRALDDLASAVASRFLELSSEPTGKVLELYARDHLRTPLRDERG